MEVLVLKLDTNELSDAGNFIFVIVQSFSLCPALKRLHITDVENSTFGGKYDGVQEACWNWSLN